MSFTPDERTALYRDQLRKQAAVNKVLLKASAEAQRNEELGFRPAARQFVDLEEERGNMNAQRNAALDTLRKTLRPEVAAQVVQGWGDESVLFFNMVDRDFLSELKRFNTTKLDATFVGSLWDRYADKYSRTQGIDIPMQSGEKISVRSVDPAAAKGLADTLVAKADIDADDARSFVARLSRDDISSINNEDFADYVKPLGPKVNLMSVFKGYAGRIKTLNRELKSSKRLTEGDLQEVNLDAYRDWKRESDKTITDLSVQEHRLSDLINERDALEDRRIEREILFNEATRPLLNEHNNARDKLTRKQQELDTLIQAIAEQEQRRVSAKNTKTRNAAQTKISEYTLSKAGVEGEIKVLEKKIKDNNTAGEDVVASFNEDMARMYDDLRRISQDILRVGGIKVDLRKLQREKDKYVDYVRDEEPRPGEETKEERRFYGFGMLPPVRRDSGITTTRLRPDNCIKFGKHMIHIPSLDKGYLNLRFPKGGNNNKLPRTKMSPELHEVLVKSLERGKIIAQDLRKMSVDDKRLLKKACDIARVEHPIVIEEDEAEMDRFKLIQGEIIAGNDNPQIIKEFKGLIVKFRTQGRLAHGEAQRALAELALIT